MRLEATRGWAWFRVSGGGTDDAPGARMRLMLIVLVMVVGVAGCKDSKPAAKTDDTPAEPVAAEPGPVGEAEAEAETEAEGDEEADEELEDEGDEGEVLDEPE